MTYGAVGCAHEDRPRPAERRRRAVAPCGCRHYCDVANEDSREAIDYSVKKWLDGDSEHQGFDLLGTDWELHQLEEWVDDRHYAIIQMFRKRRLRQIEAGDGAD